MAHYYGELGTINRGGLKRIKPFWLKLPLSSQTPSLSFLSCSSKAAAAAAKEQQQQQLKEQQQQQRNSSSSSQEQQQQQQRAAAKIR